MYARGRAAAACGVVSDILYFYCFCSLSLSLHRRDGLAEHRLQLVAH